MRLDVLHGEVPTFSLQAPRDVFSGFILKSVSCDNCYPVYSTKTKTKFRTCLESLPDKNIRIYRPTVLQVKKISAWSTVFSTQKCHACRYYHLHMFPVFLITYTWRRPLP